VEQLELLRYAVEALERLAIPYAIVGSFASSVWGESRFTQDIDIVVDLAPSQVRELCAAFPAEEFYVSQDAALDAVARGGQFNVIHPSSGNKIDFMISGRSAWAASQLRRFQRLQLGPGLEGAVASPEDVILSKMVYYLDGGSDKHLRDIAGILKISGERVEPEYIERFAPQLGVSEIWQAIVARLVQN
jgi:hypothetical protein